MSKEPARAHAILFLNTLAFTVCFAAWMLNGVLVTFLVSNQVFDWSPSQMGWLIGIPVLTGALVRLPLGMLTDRFGGRSIRCSCWSPPFPCSSWAAPTRMPSSCC